MKFVSNSVGFYLLILLACHGALAFQQAMASDFRFVIQRKSTHYNQVLAKGSTTIKASFKDQGSFPDSFPEKSPVGLLNEAINSNSTAAATLLADISDMRENGEPQEEIEAYLNNLLKFGPDASIPFWTKSKRLARLSRRARLASLRRTLDLTTPSTDNDEDQSAERRLFRRRRALVSLLQSLSSKEVSVKKEPAIVTLEKRARQASKEESLDMRSRMPEGLETPDFDILTELKFGRRKVQIRRYKPYSVCSVSMNKPRPTSAENTDAKVQMPEINGASSFGALAGYLFGKNDKSTAMKMTTPVFTSPGVDDGDKEMEFVMPSDYWESGRLDSAPQPLSGSGVILKQRESQERAVLMFGGYASKKEVAKRKKELLDALKKDKQWTTDEEQPTIAQYNDPFTVPWRRLNEVSIKVVEK
jgi:hypothetical protein